MKMSYVKFFFLAFLLAAISCGDTSSVEGAGDAGATGGGAGTGVAVGTGGTSGGAGGSSGAGGAATDGGSGSMQAVQAIFDARCILCHDARKLGIPADPGVPLTSDKSYDTLVGKAGQEPCGGLLVVPGNPTASYLYQKVTSDTPCSGERMPRPFEIGPRVDLSAADVATIRTWIAAGAPR